MGTVVLYNPSTAKVMMAAGELSGPNIIVNGTFDDSANWLIGDDWSISAGQAHYRYAPFASGALGQLVSISGNGWTLEFDLILNTGTAIGWWLWTAGGVCFIENNGANATGHWKFEDIACPGGVTCDYLYFTSGGGRSSSYDLDNVELYQGTPVIADKVQVETT